jgi:colanic acid/amylovoran biosynthesis glycosyltransferase
MGLPVVGTRHAGIPEILQHGRTGFLVPERSAHQLAQGILLILGRPVLRLRMGLAARANVCRNYNLKDQNARLEELYVEAVRGHAERKARLRSSPGRSLFSDHLAPAKVVP